MGQMAQVMYDQAEENFAAAMENLIAEYFQRGADSLGPHGWGELGRDLHHLAHNFAADADLPHRVPAGVVSEQFEGLMHMLAGAFERASELCYRVQQETSA